MRKQPIVVLAAGILCLSLLSGCGTPGETGARTGSESSRKEAAAEGAAEADGSEELIFVNYRDIRDLNPHLYGGEMYAQEMLFETLVNITEDGYEGCLAESWDISEDGRIYTFHIRPGIIFSDGQVCDANAIKANFDAILENRDRHTWLEMMSLLTSVSAPDEHTFVIELSEP